MSHSSGKGIVSGRGCFLGACGLLVIFFVVLLLVFVAEVRLFGRDSAHYINSLRLSMCASHLSRSLSEDPEVVEAYKGTVDGLETGELTDGYGRPFVYVPYSETLGYGSIAALGRDGKEGGDFFGLNKDRIMLFDEYGLFSFEGTNRVYWRKN